MQTLLDVILPVFLVIGAGYLATNRGVLSPDNIDGVLKFTQNVGLPCLLFQAIARLDLAASFDPYLLTAFYAGPGLCFATGAFAARLLLRRDWEDCVVIGFCCLFSNSILLGLPIMERAYGTASLAGNFAIVSVHAPFCYGLGITVMEFVRNRNQSGLNLLRGVGRAMFRNALVLGILTGFAVNLSGLPLPGIISDAVALIAGAALPAALFALGGVLVQYRPQGDTRAIVMVCAFALLLHPALVLGIGTAWKLPTDALRSGVITAAMAPGINAYIFASIYNRAKRVAATSVLMSTAASIATVWMWLSVLP